RRGIARKALGGAVVGMADGEDVRAHGLQRVQRIQVVLALGFGGMGDIHVDDIRSEEHTSELQSRFDLVCRLLLEKKKSGQATACWISCVLTTGPGTATKRKGSVRGDLSGIVRAREL